MTDDEMNALLHDLGGRWRASTEQAPPPAVRTPRPRRWPLIASAAAVAAALVAGAVVALTALGGDRTRPAAPLTGTVWRLTGDGSSAGTLYISPDGRLVADDVCTVVGASVNADGGRLVPTDFQVRHRGCTDAVGERLGDDFVDLLTDAPTYDVDGDTLRIGSGSAQRRFVADPDTPSPTIDVPTVDEATWTLIGVRDAAGRSSKAPAGVRFRINDTRLTTSDGCHRIEGDVAVGGRGLDVRRSVHQLPGCAADADAAAVISGVLADTVTQQVLGNRLTLTRKGAGTLTYEWIPDDTSATDPARLMGPTFRLVGVEGKAADGAFAIGFADGKHHDNLACNYGEGAATLTRGAFRLARPSSTSVLCPKELSDGQQRTVDRILYDRTALWRLQDGKLVVRGDGAQSSALVFTATGRESSGLQGDWTVVSVQPGAVSGLGGLPVISFTDDTVRVLDVCAAPPGPYSVKGASLYLPRPLALGGCSTTNAAEVALKAVLGGPGPIGYRVSGTMLTLTVGATTITLSRV